MRRYALSIRQPWAWLIVHGYKDIENRKWRSPFRGFFMVHAGKVMTWTEYSDCKGVVAAVDNRIVLPEFDDLRLGGFVGEAEMIGCVESSRSPWFSGPWGFELQNGKEMPFVAAPGKLGFFETVKGGPA